MSNQMNVFCLLSFVFVDDDVEVRLDVGVDRKVLFSLNDDEREREREKELFHRSSCICVCVCVSSLSDQFVVCRRNIFRSR